MNVLAQYQLQNNNNENNIEINIPELQETLAELMGELTKNDEIQMVQNWSQNLSDISNLAKVILKNYCDENGNAHIIHTKETYKQIIDFKTKFQTLSYMFTQYSNQTHNVIQWNKRGNATIERADEVFNRVIVSLAEEVTSALAFLLTLESMCTANLN
ncbi:hypothetical protein DICPUDRAFT_154369 [Dictyostelium purpureum]|uniref:Uncharacterized protein n=1 Tax=Dictyostelium purpureum TaxID=5786 RepID=F0ZR64_DICPU|nr:uncharacterized protein DICPUDRAFT_154369 [Dictyostelium purpureum]EGC33564.1 hypothetical protein DICPUDRAFT_154369 [Dictyostelium purpureum]|eukprot:XP_003289913.1 hypothetical protein DICPUDRAFT_154369 [Dictyostelium purpureum]